jgi:hypothetical protein
MKMSHFRKHKQTKEAEKERKGHVYLMIEKRSAPSSLMKRALHVLREIIRLRAQEQ